MKKCSECNGIVKKFKTKTPEGVEYSYFRCNKCGEETVDMKQLHKVAEKYRVMRKYQAKLSKWGLSLGVRIPKELVREYGLTDNKEVNLIPEKTGIKIVPI
jgi:hypothetical protein